MQKIVLFSFLSLNLFFGLQIEASNEFHVDQFNLNVRTDHIVGCLWRNDDVSDEDIEEAFSAISISSSENSSDSSDTDSHPRESLDRKNKEAASVIDEFAEFTKSVADDRHKTAAERRSLNAFIEKMRALKQEVPAFVLKQVLFTIADKY